MADSRAAAAEARIAQLAKRLDAIEGVGTAGESNTRTHVQLSGNRGVEHEWLVLIASKVAAAAF